MPRASGDKTYQYSFIPERDADQSKKSAGAKKAGDSGVARAQRHGGYRLPLPQTLVVPKRKIRTPAEGDDWVVCSFRPRGMAGNRLFDWKAPYIIERERVFVEAYGQEAYDHFRMAMLNSIAPSTRVQYSAGLLRFAQFCDTLKIPEESRFPVEHELLAMFICYQVGKGASASHWVDGIRMWHIINGVPWTRDAVIRTALNAHKSFIPADARRPPRPPVTPEHLTALRKGLNFEDPLESAVYAAACVAFWAVCRLGELVPQSGPFDPSKHVRRDKADFRKLQKGEKGDIFMTIRIPYEKVQKSMGADIIVMNVVADTSPLHALHWHLTRSSPGLSGKAPLFAYSDGSGKKDGWFLLTKKTFMKTCERVWKEAGLPAIPYGHSFRIGGATEYLLRGMEPERVQKLGRWSSMAFLVYWRKVEKIIPLWSSVKEQVSEMTKAFKESIDAFKKKYDLVE